MTQPTNGITFFNTLTRTKERFTPIENGKVRMYTCGPTVYDYAHIGNFRAFLFEDLLKRWLQYRGYKVTHVMNITDIDDKTIRGAQKQQIPLRQFTESFAEAFFQDIATLNIQPANHYPKATDHIPEMTSLIATLIRKGYAYKSEDGSTYYAINKFPAYGKLSHIHIQQLQTATRTKTDEYTKEEAQDFALWKAWTPEDQDVYWQTEHGKGRPGWHIECSAMSMKYLGETFDIHCGGIDNMFPHHENEIAQSEAATGKPFVHYWMHNEHLLVEGKKMAKRFGNFYTLRDLLAKGYDPIAIRYLLMSTHYRQQFNFTFEGLEAAKGAVERLRTFFHRLSDVDGKESNGKVAVLTAKLEACFGGSMDDDLNIGIALASLFDFLREINNLIDANMVSKKEAAEISTQMIRLDDVLGIKIQARHFKVVVTENLGFVSKVEVEEGLPNEIIDLLQKREVARKAKNWKEADAIRAQINSKGFLIEDTARGVTAKKQKS